MNRETFNNAIQAFLNRTPFKPFTIALRSKDRYVIDGPNSIAVRNGVVSIILKGGVPVWFDHINVTEIIGAAVGQNDEGDSITPPHVVEGDPTN